MVMRLRSFAAAASLVVSASIIVAACREPLDDNLSEIEAPRVLAIIATPPEAAPKEEITYRAVVADAGGELIEGGLDWAYCIARKPQSTLGPVDDACLAATGTAIVPIGNGLEATGPLPDDTCRLFGPDPPQVQANAPAGRAVDPDPSGGYYQPLRILTGQDPTAVVIGQARIVCGLAGAPPEVATDFTRRYRPNANPTLSSLRWIEGGADVAPDLDASGHGEPVVTVPLAARVTLRATWPACPEVPTCGDGMCTVGETKDDCAVDCAEPADDCEGDCPEPRGCGGSELYLLQDIERRVLVEQRESIRVSWFTTAGSFEVDHTGREASEAGTQTSDDVWIAPDAAADATIFVVLRDDRGGTGYARYRIRVGG